MPPDFRWQIFTICCVLPCPKSSETGVQTSGHAYTAVYYYALQGPLCRNIVLPMATTIHLTAIITLHNSSWAWNKGQDSSDEPKQWPVPVPCRKPEVTTDAG